MNPSSFSCAVALAWAATACITDVEVGRLARAASTTGTTGDAAILVPGCEPVSCRGRPAACADCVDNDGDGRVDANDPDCYGPCDDSEVAFAGSRQPCPGDVCFFDTDCGEGNDERCVALIPNGCDCHGCCEIPSGGAVLLASFDDAGRFTCSASSLDDPLSCHPCTIDPSCHNSCDECESCFANPFVASSCALDGGCSMPLCPEGRAPCSEVCGAACPDDQVCVTGCCVGL